MLFTRYVPLFTVFTVSLKLMMINALNINVKSASSHALFSRVLTKNLPNRYISMNLDGLKKLQVMEPQTTKKQGSPNTLQELGTSQSLFRSPPALGAGTDERFSSSLIDGRMEKDAALLTKVHMSYMQHSLLADLTSDKYGMKHKMEKVQFASKEQLLGSSYNYQWQPSSAHAGGLMNDWTFNME